MDAFVVPGRASKDDDEGCDPLIRYWVRILSLDNN